MIDLLAIIQYIHEGEQHCLTVCVCAYVRRVCLRAYVKHIFMRSSDQISVCLSVRLSASLRTFMWCTALQLQRVHNMSYRLSITSLSTHHPLF